MFKEKIKQLPNTIKQTIKETFNLLWKFKWYIFVFLFFYLLMFLDYSSPGVKNYFLWEDWCDFDKKIYQGVMELLLFIFSLTFLIATSNMRNHPVLTKLIFLASYYFMGTICLY